MPYLDEFGIVSLEFRTRLVRWQHILIILRQRLEEQQGIR